MIQNNLTFGKNITRQIFGQAVKNADAAYRGWIGILDMLTIAAYFPDSRGVAVEIGTAMGRSAAFMASLNPEVHVYTIDSLSGFEISDGTEMKKEEIRNHLDRVLAPYPNLTFIEGDSRKVTPPGLIDLLFIDGNHTYPGVQSDYDRFSPRVKTGGVILFHDVANHRKDPGKEVEVIEFINDRKLPITIEHNMGIYIKE